MAPVFTYSDPRGIDEPAITVALSSNVGWGQFGVQMSAELGQPSVSTVELDDPFGVYDFVGLRAFTISETSAPSNNSIIGRFVMEDRIISRGASERTTTARKWQVDLTDYNWHLGKRVFVDADAKRPAETPGDRIRWLLHHAAHINLWDMGHVVYPTSPVLEAADYRGQRPTDLLADCAVEGGYNFWVDYNEALNRPELFFFHPDSGAYAASICISNDLADIDSLTFAPYEDATLRRSPSRIAYGVFLAWANGNVYVRNDTVGEQFGKIDQTAPMSNVRSEARARRVATKFLNDNDEEDDRITCSIKVPRSQVNDIRHGHLVAVKFTHLPGYEDWRALRVLRKTVIQQPEGGDGYYLVTLEMSSSAAYPPLPAFTGSAFAALIDHAGTSNWYDDDTWYTTTGDAVPGGWYEEPTVGDMWTFGSNANGYMSITTSRVMTVRIEAQVQFATVATVSTATLNVTINGAVAGTASVSWDTGGGGPGYWSSNINVDFETTLNAGDVVSFQTISSGFLINGWGAADLSPDNTYLRIGRGPQGWNFGGPTLWYGAS
jgi:hypothetical protein